MGETTVRLPQLTETAPEARERSRFVYRFVYYRSAESQEYNESGQDYLAIREDGQRLAFALCDGVGQSFYGDVAARHLGDALLDWLWQLPSAGDRDRIGEALAAFLADLTRTAMTELARVPLPANIPPLVHSVLEEKREHGSESTFVCGVLDAPAEWLALAWLGDTRLRLWDVEGRECTAALGLTFHTRQRWSTRRGAVGSPPHVHVASTSPGAAGSIARLLAYTDGLAALDALPFPPSAATLREVIAAALGSPTSDDISLFDLTLTPASDPPFAEVGPPPIGDTVAEAELQSMNASATADDDTATPPPRLFHGPLRTWAAAITRWATAQRRAWEDRGRPPDPPST